MTSEIWYKVSVPPHPFVARVESGQRRIDVIELIVLARAMGASAADLLAVAASATGADHSI